MRAITIRQPWASMIVHCGKDIENRTWRTSYRGPLLIHAGTAHDEVGYLSAYSFTRSRSGLHLPLDWIMSAEGSDRDWKDWMNDELPRRGVIGIAEIVDCVSGSDSPWFAGPYGFVLRNVKPLEFFAYPGKQGFFDIDYPHSI